MHKSFASFIYSQRWLLERPGFDIWCCSLLSRSNLERALLLRGTTKDVHTRVLAQVLWIRSVNFCGRPFVMILRTRVLIAITTGCALVTVNIRHIYSNFVSFNRDKQSVESAFVLLSTRWKCRISGLQPARTMSLYRSLLSITCEFGASFPTEL